MGAAEEKRNLERSALLNTPVCSRGVRERAPGKGGKELGRLRAVAR